MKYGRLTVTSSIYRIRSRQFVETLCDCGTAKRVRLDGLLSGAVQSCGCMQRELLALRVTRHGAASAYRQTPEYTAWAAMLQRCYNPRSPNWKHYGARGIKVCEAWQHSFETFLREMGKRPSASHSLDRIDNDGPYEWLNCRWATRTQQAASQRHNKGAGRPSA